MMTALFYRKWVLLCAFLLAAGGTSAALGQAQNPPPWWNNDDGRTFRESYAFDDASDPPVPTPGITPPWYPHIGTLVEPEGDCQWIAEVGGRPGVWGVSGQGQRGTITFFIWNEEAEDNEKTVWLQYDSYTANGAIGGPSCKAGPPPRSAGGFSIPNQAVDLGNGWQRHWRQWVIKPQPMWEEITFTLGTVASGGTAAIDNVQVGSHCEPIDDHDGDDSAFDFNIPDWPPPSDPFYRPPDYLPPAWERSGDWEPDWMPGLGDHEGVIGLPGGFPAYGALDLWTDGRDQPEGVTHAACQFDFYMAEGGLVAWAPTVSPDSTIENVRETILDIGGGWQRCLLQFDATPPPDWKSFHWELFTDPLTGPVAIDNVMMSAGTLFADDWFEDFDFYTLGSGLHGVYGWKGWDNDPTVDAIVDEAQAHSSLQAVAIEGASDLVHEFQNADAGRWTFSAWSYVPSDFVGGGTPPTAGSYFILLNTYVDGGPHEASDWSVQMGFDSNDGMLKVFHGDGLNTIDVPYATDRWTQIQVVVDLDEDWTRIYYDDSLITEYSWTGGVLGVGGGAADIAAVDLYANASTVVFYDDLRLWPAGTPGDLNCDGQVNAFDIDPLILALTDAAAYWDTYVGCDRLAADIDDNGHVNAFDIDPFIDLLTGG